MIAYVLRRLVSAVGTLVVVLAVTFAIFFMIPKLTGSDPAALYTGRRTDAAAIAAIRLKLGFDQPIWVQFGRFIKGIFVGRDYNAGPDITHCAAPCFGYSFRTDQEVWPLLLDRLPVTAGLALGAALIWLVFGIGAGVVSALRKGSLADRGLMVTALAGVSLPIYFTGLLATLIFVYQVEVLPAISDTSLTENPWLWFRMMILPWVTLAFLYAAAYARYTRAGMLEAMSEDYVRTARAKGLTERTVIGKHALRPGLTPLVTIFGLDLGALLGGAILTETTFGLPGIGRLAVAVGQPTGSADHPRRHPLRRVLHRDRESHRRPALWPHRPPRSDWMSVRFSQKDARMSSGPQLIDDTVGQPLVAPKAFLDVRDLQVRFKTDDGIVKAVDGLSFTVERGQTLGIVGESGSGKSVTSLAILGLHRTRSTATVRGQVWLDGEDLISADDEYVRGLRGRKMAMIFQDPLTAMHPYFSIGAQIVEAYQVHHQVSKQEARKHAIEMLDRVGIPQAAKRVDDYPHQFSGGMRQRAMIAMALVNGPSLLIADEPTTALDVTVQAQILDLIRDLQKEFGTAVIIITHDLGVVAELADDILVMYAGKCVEKGPAQELFRQPEHPYTWGLLGSMPRMDRDVRDRLIPISGSPPSLINLPSGCAFHPRCPYAGRTGGLSQSQVPALTGGAHAVACHMRPAERRGIFTEDIAPNL